MIRSLFVKNIALIDALNVDFSEGFNVISGETGAGKSILIDSINFVLGDRADKSLIRYGEDSARVELVFDIGDRGDLKEFFDDYGLEYEPSLIVSRTISVGGRSDCRLNGRPVTLATLKKLVSKLVDLHGQHENQSLMEIENHIRILDNYAGGANSILNEFREEFLNYHQLQSEKAQLLAPEERLRQIDLLEYQRDEIEKAALKEGEEEEIKELRERFSHMEKIMSAVSAAAEYLDGEQGATSSLSVANATLSGVTRYDTVLEALEERLESAKIEVADIADELKSYLENADFDRNTMDRVEKRYDEIKSLKRKYGASVDAMLQFLDSVNEKLKLLYGAEERFTELDALIGKSETKLIALSEKLYRIRLKAAQNFEKEIVRELRELGMKNTEFSVSFDHTQNPDELTKNGGDRVEFLISPNLGEPLRPLRKIASGGEMSRFMLALKTITANLDSIDTLIFDEIDTGISGGIAKVVGIKLSMIAKTKQVLVVTHLPQIAAMSDTHFLIEKSVEGEKTRTALTLLDERGVLNEIVRLTGGVEGSAASESHAKELRKWALDCKK